MGAIIAAAYVLGEFSRVDSESYSSRVYQPARDHLSPQHPRRVLPRSLPYEPYCDAPATLDDADLCAQWASVQSVEEGNRLSRVALTINFFEAAGLLLSLIFTAWAALAAAKATRIAEASIKDSEMALSLAKQSAEAAQQQVMVAQTTAKQQLRPYLTCKNTQLSIRDDDDYVLTTELDNIGETPATITRVEVRVAWCADGKIFDLGGSSSEDSFKLVKNHPIVLPAEVPFGDIDHEIAGKLIVVCEVSYTDIFGDSHTENEAWQSPKDFLVTEEDFPISPNLDSYMRTLKLVAESEPGTLKQKMHVS